MKNTKWLSQNEIYKKIGAYCAYQERCHSEVRSKLISLGCYGDDLENTLALLVEENFINEERYAIHFAQSKFNQKSWGKLKITSALKFKNISPYCIQKALRSIPEKMYTQSLNQILLKKLEDSTPPYSYPQKSKAYQYALQKGYEPDLITNCLNDITS